MKSQGLDRRVNSLLSMLICISLLLQMQPATIRAAYQAGAVSPGATRLTSPSSEPGLSAPLLGPLTAPAFASEQLSSGWHLLSLPERPDDPAAAAVLASLSGSYSRAYAYNACDSADPWKLYDPAAPAAANDLTTIDHTIGLWVELTATDSLEVASTPQPNTEIALCPGWNLIGYPLAQARPVADALASIAGKYSLVFAYDPIDAIDPWETYDVGAPSWSSDLQQLTPGRGYWIYATAAATLTFTAPTPPPAGPDITLPRISILIEPPVINIGESATITVLAEDNVGVASLQLTVNGEPVPVGPDGKATFTASVAGTFTIIAQATDAAGNTASATDLLRARAAVDNGPPTVALTAPADASLIEASTDLIGTATDDDLSFYELQATPLETDSFATFATGGTPVSDGKLARLDPRMFRPGPYLLRACAEDTWGNRACSEPLQYDMAQGLSHPGVVRLAFQDGFVDTVGLPLSIRRVYDSRDKTVGDFGVGWRLEVDEVKLSTTRMMGKDWAIKREGVNFPTFKLVPAKSHRVIVTSPDGRVHRFELSLEPQSQAINPIQFVTGAFFDPLPGTTSKLTASGDPPAFVSPVRDFGGPVEILKADQSLYDPNGYTLTMPDGRELSFARIGTSRSFRLTTLRDAAGNVVTIGPNGISHSNGASIGMTRDSAGRITRITNPDGGERTYSYDTAGDLTATTDYETATTRYRYDDSHNLIQVIDPRGYTPGTMVYDEYGRLVAVIDRNGQRVELAHNDSTNQETVTDRLGNTTITTYDDQGNVISIIDAYSKETRFTYDANDYLASRTNPLGDTELFSYNAAGNLLSYTNALSKTWQNEYDAGGRLTVEIDPLGRTSRYEYDAGGNQTASVSPSGARTELRYSSSGALIGITDAAQGSATITRDINGNLTGYIDPLGRSGTLTRRTDGQITRDQFIVDGQTIAYDYRYDQNGSLTGMTLPNGNTAAMSYNAAGMATRSTDAAGNTQTVAYDTNDRISSFSDIDSRVTSLEYNAEGQVTEVVQPNGERAERTLDRLGRATRIALPTGQVTQVTYDDAGRIIRQESVDQGAIEFTYDAAGRVERAVDADGTTHYEWDAANQLVAVVGPLNERTEFAYDLDGNLRKTTFPDGNSVETQFDELGRPEVRIDERGARIEYTYDLAGELTSVKDTAGGLTTYTYNALGSPTLAVTPGGSEWRFSYDSFGNKRTQTFPWGGTETYTRDALERVTGITDATGVSAQFAYDPKGRITRRVLGPNHTEQLAYNAGGQLESVTGPAGITRYQYTTGGRISRVDYPDGTFVAYEYDTAHRTATLRTQSGTTTYGYDTKGRLVSVVDSILGGTTYSYDAAGRVSREVLPDGSTTTYTRDDRGWITALRTVAADGTTVIRDEQISYDAAGNPLQRTEVGRQVTYSYDAAGRVAGETRSGDDAGTQDYDYDADWNLVQNGSRALSYDGKMRLTSDGRWTSYTYDAAGRPVTRSDGTVSEQFSYDAIGRLVRVNRSGALPARVDLQYNDKGLLSRVVADGVGRTLIWETAQEVPQLLEERDDNGTLIRRYVRGLGPIGLQDSSGSYVLHEDMLGSVRLVTGVDGAVRSRYAFSAYGEQTLGAGDSTSPLRFAGEYLVPELGLYFLRSRFYDPGAGRFLTPDILAPGTSLPQTYNPYLYVGANPVRFTDPLGTFSIGSVSMALSIASILVNIALPAFPNPFVWVATKLGFPVDEVLDSVGLSAVATFSYNVCAFGLQVDLLWGPTTTMGILWGSVGFSFGNSDPRLGALDIAFTLGDIIGKAENDPEPPHNSFQVQVTGTLVKPLLQTLDKGRNGTVTPKWRRRSGSVQWEMFGETDGYSKMGTFFNGFTVYGGDDTWLDSESPVKLKHQGRLSGAFFPVSGISFAFNFPFGYLTYTKNPSGNGWGTLGGGSQFASLFR